MERRGLANNASCYDSWHWLTNVLLGSLLCTEQGLDKVHQQHTSSDVVQKDPSLGFLRVFSTKVWVTVLLKLRRKGGARAKKLTFLGYQNNMKAFRFVNDQKMLSYSRSTSFCEHSTGRGSMGMRFLFRLFPLTNGIQGVNEETEEVTSLKSQLSHSCVRQKYKRDWIGRCFLLCVLWKQATRVAYAYCRKVVQNQAVGSHIILFWCRDNVRALKVLWAMSAGKKIRSCWKSTGWLMPKWFTTPMTPGYMKEPNNVDIENKARYQSLVGFLLYLVHWSRPDICYAVHILCQKSSCPYEDWVAAKRVLRHLKGMVNSQTSLKSTGRSTGTGILRCKLGDRPYGKSTTGFVIYLCGALIVWKSVKQLLVAISTCEAEFSALTVFFCWNGFFSFCRTWRTVLSLFLSVVIYST